MTEARREAILAAAKAVFEDVGFEHATMSEITARAGGSKATLYRYFESKDALFEELLRRSASEHSGAVLSMLHGGTASVEAELTPVLALLRPEANVAATLQQVGEQVLRQFHTPEKIQARRMVIAAAAANSGVGRLFYENGPGKGLEHMAQYFGNVMQAGQLRQADPKLAAAHFRALVESEMEEASLLNARPPLSDEEIRDFTARAVDVFIRAYGPEAPAPAG